MIFSKLIFSKKVGVGADVPDRHCSVAGTRSFERMRTNGFRDESRYLVRVLFFFILFFNFTSLQAAERRVEAEGMAPGEHLTAREEALADALREAVRLGAGIDITSQTRITDMQLDYDRMFGSAFGYVRDYAVIESSLGADGIYRVKVKATVGDTAPDRRDVVALQQMVRLKGSPRVALQVDELIEGIPTGSELAKPWFENSAREMQLHLVDLATVNRNDDRLAARDAFFGEGQQAAMRRADFSQEADFLIQAKVRGRYLGKQGGQYGSLPEHRFSYIVDLRALRPNGQVIASVSIPGNEHYDSRLDSPDAAAREILHKLLQNDAWSLYRKIIVQWMTELDLGSLIRLEFAQIPDVDYDAVQQALRNDSKVTSVWSREFDSQGLSFIDVESRLKADALKRTVLNALGNYWSYDRGTDDYLQFKPSGYAHSNLTASAQSTRVPPSAHGLPPWAWTLIGAGGVVLLFWVYHLRKNPKK